MPSAKLLIGGIAAVAALGLRVARSGYGRGRILAQADRPRIEPRAEDLEQRALRAANETFAAALVETAEVDPEIGADEVRELGEELRRELERLAGADIKASRTRSERATPPG